MPQSLSYRVEDHSWKIEIDEERRIASSDSAKICVENYHWLRTALKELEKMQRTFKRTDIELMKSWGFDAEEIPQKIVRRKAKIQHCLDSLVDIMSRSRAFTVHYGGVTATPAQFALIQR